MCKSRGNVINPDEIVAEIGADAFRLYEMFMGAFDQPIPWSTTAPGAAAGSWTGCGGCRTCWTIPKPFPAGHEATTSTGTIKKVSDDYERMKYNTAIAAMMTLVNAFYAKGRITRGEMKVLIQLLNPVAPHITEEINQICEFGPELIHKPWPKCDEKALVKESVEIALQINGKVRGKLEVPTSLTREGAQEYFLALEDVQKLVAGREIRKLVYVPGRLVNIVL